MITVKFSADNIRLFQKARSEGELRGAVDLVLERVEQSKTLKSFGKEPQVAAKSNWREAQSIMAEVLGSDLIVPPFPDGTWYQRIYRTIKEWGLNAVKLREIAVYAKENLKPPYQMSFLITQHRRILEGEWNVATKEQRKEAYNAGFRKDLLPDG